jgi:peptidoglycan L-alanyl-D-glutamate endopeptidase CwlK
LFTFIIDFDLVFYYYPLLFPQRGFFFSFNETKFMDTHSFQLIELLHPNVRQTANSAYTLAVQETPANVHPYISETLRTFVRSDYLYQLGRTIVNPDGKSKSKPLGNRVSNARAGQSYHNYGLALDYGILINGKISWKVDKYWLLVASIFMDHGFDWGGNWKTIKDYPHVEMRFQKNWRELLILHDSKKVDKDGYVLL